MTISANWHNFSSFHSILQKNVVHSYLCFAQKQIPHKIWHNSAYCSTICHSKISSLGELFLFLITVSKVLNLLCFFSTQIDHLNGLQTIIKLWTSESHSALWHNLAQFNSICHPVHYWAQYGLVWHIIKAEYLNPITKTSPLVQFEKIQLNLPQFGCWVRRRYCLAGITKLE